jgi:hypothetical protein
VLERLLEQPGAKLAVAGHGGFRDPQPFLNRSQMFIADADASGRKVVQEEIGEVFV